MIIDYDSFARASTGVHIAQGAALFMLGAAEAYSHDNPGSRAALAGPLALLAAAIAIPLIMLGTAGSWNLDQLLAALDIRRDFYLFIAFACLFGAAGMSLPILAAATRLWSEEEHVHANREIYRRNFDLAETILDGRYGFFRPAGGFYLWLDVGDGAEAAKKLWGEAGIRVLPGGFMSKPGPDGINHGHPYIRVAMVYDQPMMETALKLMTQVL